MRTCGFLPATSLASAKSQSGHSGTFPLTEAQKEIWLAAQMGGEAAVAYNESLKLQFRGPFDLEAFRAAANQIVRRHPILTASINADGQSQRVELDVKLDLPLLDFSN